MARATKTVKATETATKTVKATETATKTAKATETATKTGYKKEITILVKASGTATQAARDAMLAYGYKDENSYKENGIAFIAAKRALQNVLIIDHGPFAIGDKSDTDRKYARCVTLMSQSCEVGLKNGKPVTESKPRPKKGKKAETVINRQSPKLDTIELDDKLAAAMVSNEINFKGTIADMIDAYEIEIFAYIASDEDILTRLLEVIKNGKKQVD